MKIEEKGSKLVVVDFDEFEAYRIACKIEKDGIRFYRKLSESVNNAEAKNILEFLMEEEKKHLRFFEDCVASLRESAEDETEDDDLIPSADFGVFQPYQGIVELEKAMSDTRKGLRLGIIIEEKSIQFYGACQQELSAADAKMQIGRIIEEENRHKDLLERMARNLPEKVK
ncbi:MAG TPA: ferritin family protein [Patescibacteria group bacterium]|nr:ferritin family protein [Patescibacteria group bacterium]